VRVADLTVERIKALADRPFMITASFNGPHDPNVVPSPYYERFDPAKITPPVNAAFREKRFEGDWGRRVVADLGEPGLREFLRIYHATVKMIDDQVGRILAALDAAGLTDDTVIVFTADHGDMAGGHGMVWKSTGAFYDEIVRVPLLIRYPRRFRPQVSDLAADLTDLRPTLLGLTALKAPGAAHGQDLAPFLDGRRPAPQARAFAFSERVGGNTKLTRQIGPRAKGSFMLRGQGWKYVRYAGGEEFLYHLTEDPGEMKNLAGDPKCDARRKELAGKMDAWLARTGWPGGPA